jgi:hypothetical protein
MEVIIPAVIGSISGACLVTSVAIYCLCPNVWVSWFGRSNKDAYIPELVQVKNHVYKHDTGHLRIQIPKH